MNESGNKENRVGMQIADPNLVIKKKALKKWMNRHPKSPLEKIFKNNDLTSSGIRVTLPFWCPPAAKLLVVQKPHLDEVIEGPHGAPGFFPLLGHHLGPFLRVTLRHFYYVESFEQGVEWLRVLRKTTVEGRRQGAGMRLLGKEQGHNIRLFMTTDPPLPLPAFLGSGWFFRRLRRFSFQESS